MKFLISCLAAVLLTGCGDTQYAAYMMGGGNHSLSLTRQQEFVWADWETNLIVARYPECQRRYPLKGVVSDRIKMDLYRVSPGVFILNAGKRWYVTETAECRFEQYKEAPPEPGELIGTFQIKDDELQYIDKEAKPAEGKARKAAAE
jgi:hypothetical protein